jgi:oligopeptide transport system substrate-binding protein
MRLGLRKLSLPGLLVLVGTLAVVVAGCGTGSSSSNALPDSKQILTIPITPASVDIKTLDPAKNQDFYSYFPIYMTFPGMVELDPNGNVIPWAASAMPTFDTTTNSYTFKIRSGLKWSDGTPIDANTFAYSLNRALNPCVGSVVTYYLYPIKDAAAFSTETCASDGTTIKGKIQSLIGDSLTVPDSQTLVVTLGAPAPYFLEALCYPTAFAQPQQLITQFGNKDWINHIASQPGGFGGNLFKITVWDHKGNLDLVRNDAFWGTKPKLSQVHFKIYQTTASEYADYLDGKLDQGVAPSAQYKASKTRSDFHEGPFLSIGYYQPVWTKKPFDDIRVRQAFDLALNKTVLADQVNQGSLIATNHIVPQGMPGFFPGLVGPDGTASLTGNVTKATQLMQSYATDKCGGQISKCTPVTLFASNDPSIVTQDQAAVQMWQTAFPGLQIKTSFIDFNTLISLIYSPNVPQIFDIGWVTDYLDPQDWLSLQFGNGAINNTGFVTVPAANTLMAQADVNLDPTSRFTQYNQAEQLLVTDGAWIPYGEGKTFYNVQPYVHNFTINSLGTIPLTGPDSWQTIFLTSH